MTDIITSTNLLPMERMLAATREYMAALEEYASAKGVRPVWYSLADEFDFNFGFVARLEPA
ncbi:hypothetical protein [Mesorhizobium sp. B2-3-5]|uniref:hypothetical protein n=1 Tax=Mesorhizobium sp. B2-3-5 TaxID=2589958 RepID=UPI00112EDE11|nr:hypothetical protein [Mesorhizobium sp. B2-3-5]TPM36642.1 hypothetical protein FJ958_02115 [Mesorhizobium sp. B2-3-5]